MLIPCHLGDARHLRLFEHCLSSVAAQCASGFTLRVGLSGSDVLRQQARGHVETAFSPSGVRPDIQATIIDGGEQAAQFVHFRNLVDGLPPEDMVMFLDADDMYHHHRVLVFQQLAVDRNGAPFSVLAKIISSAADDADLPTVLGHPNDYIGMTYLLIEQFHITGTPDEYVDWCTDVRTLRDFLNLTPQQLCESRFCDLRFDVYMQERTYSANDKKSTVNHSQWLYFYRKSNAQETVAETCESHIVRQLYLRNEPDDLRSDEFFLQCAPEHLRRPESKRIFDDTKERYVGAFDDRSRELNRAAKALRDASQDRQEPCAVS